MTQRERQIPKALRTPRLLAAAMLMALAGAALAQDANERPGKHPEEAGQAAYLANCAACHQPTGNGLPGAFPPLAGSDFIAKNKADRKSVVQGKSVSVRVDLGGRRIITKKNTKKQERR